MRTKHHENREMHLGRGLANLVAYMAEGFLDWHGFGFVLVDDPYNFGVEIDGVPMCYVYGKRNETNIVSDHEDMEAEAIAAGKTAIVLFYGSDNHSVMRRYTPEEYDSLVLTRYTRRPDDLFYNS